jgi:hypothetical protein
VPLSVLVPVTVAEPLAAFQVCVPESVPGSTIDWATASWTSEHAMSVAKIPTCPMPDDAIMACFPFALATATTQSVDDVVTRRYRSLTSPTARSYAEPIETPPCSLRWRDLVRFRTVL